MDDLVEALTPFQRRFSDPEEAAELVSEQDKAELERRFRNKQVKRLIRRKISKMGLEDQERLAEQIVLETLRLACFDIRNLYDSAGRLLEPSELDEDTAACISGIELEKRFDEDGSGWETKKYKTYDKTKAIELFLKYVRHLSPEQKTENNVFVVLAERLARAQERANWTINATPDAAGSLPGAPVEQSDSGPAPSAGGE